LVFVLGCGETGPRSAVVVLIWAMAVVEAVPSWSLSGHTALLEEVVEADSGSQQCSESSRRRGLGEPARAGEAQLGERRHPIVAQVEPQRHSGTLVGERLVALEHCAG
jgi:hypothetical protein